MFISNVAFFLFSILLSGSVLSIPISPAPVMTASAISASASASANSTSTLSAPASTPLIPASSTDKHQCSGQLTCCSPIEVGNSASLFDRNCAPFSVNATGSACCSAEMQLTCCMDFGGFVACIPIEKHDDEPRDT